MHQMGVFTFSVLYCHYFEKMNYVCVIGIRSWAKAEAATRRAQVSKAKRREQSPAAPTAHQRPGKAASEGTKFVTDCLLITFNKCNFYLTWFKDMGSDLDFASLLQDLTELHKERQCLETQHQQEVNKLNQELQQARTLHIGLQAQADKVNIKVINKKKKSKASAAVLEIIHTVWVFSPVMLFPSLCLVSFSSVVLYPQIFCCLYQGSKIFHHFKLWPHLLPVSLSCSLCFPPLFPSLHPPLCCFLLSVSPQWKG